MMMKFYRQLRKRIEEDGFGQVIPFFVEKWMCNVVRGFYYYIKKQSYDCDGGMVVLPVNDYVMEIDPEGSGIDYDLFVFGKREVRSTDYLKTLLRPGMTVLEVGANIGYYALLEAQRVERVVAVEPVHSNIMRLRQNMVLNNVDNIDVFECAAGREPGRLPLYVNESKCNLCSVHPVDGNILSDDMVPVYTVPDILRIADCYGKVDIIRMDIEGYEFEVVMGMRDYLEEYGPLLFIELHTNKMGHNKTLSFLRILQSLNYEVLFISQDTDAIPLFSYREYRHLFNPRYQMDFSDYTISDLIDDDDVINGYYTRLLVFFAKRGDL